MSGRSAHVRKEKTKVKDTSALGDARSQHSSNSGVHQDLSYKDFPLPVGHPTAYIDPLPAVRKQSAATRSIKSIDRDDMAYARAKKPQLPNLEVSGIEKSATREKMDKMSENARKAFSGMSFGKKKKKKDEEYDHARPPTAATMRPVNENNPPEEPEFIQQSTITKNRPAQLQEIHEEPVRPGPPTGKLPPLPPAPQMKRWIGNGRQPQNWNKLRKDPELWDPHGDTLVFLAHENHRVARSPPSFRVSSHVLESIDSHFFTNALRNGYLDDNRNSDVPLSPAFSDKMGRSGSRIQHSRQGGRYTPPASESASSMQDPDGEISYELHFPPPMNLSKVDSLRYHITTRNVFAMLYQTSLVGLNFNQALMDLFERLQEYMSPESDNAGLIM